MTTVPRPLSRTRAQARGPAAPAAAHAVTRRAVAVGLVCAAFFCAVTPYNDYKVGATYLAGNQFPIGAIFVLFFFAAVVNVVLRKAWPRRAFTPGELLTIWVLILVASGLPSSGMMRYFLPHIVAPHYFSNGANNWEYKIWGPLPDWLKVKDQTAADAFFTGYPRGQERIPWEAWAGPLFFWGIPALLFLVASFCLANLLRRQWVENEKFAFPLVTLPLLLAEEPEPGRGVNALLRSRLLWLAVGLTTALHSMGGLHQLYPSIPEVTTKIDLQQYLVTPPWNQLGDFPANLYPLVVGLTYLLPAEVAFSLWFFFLFYKSEILLCALYNWETSPPLGAAGQQQFHSLQAFGGALGLFAWSMWTARRHLRDVWEKATGGPGAPAIDDSGEMFGYRATLIGLCASYGGIGLWMYLAGMPPALILTCLLIMTLALVVIAWLVTQAGTLYMAVPYGTLDVLGATLGTAPFTPGAWYNAYRVEWMFFRDTRELLLPSVLNGTKAAEAGRFPLRPLFRAVVASVGIGLIVSVASSLWVPYYFGGGNSLSNSWTYRSGPQRPLQILGGAASVPYAGSWTNWLHIAGGFAGILGLLVLRAQTGWGLHPIGFLGASVSAGRMLWVSILLGWAFKSLVQRYGGMNGYRAALPFFLGLIIGDVLNAVLWIVLGYLTGIGYPIMPG